MSYHYEEENEHAKKLRRNGSPKLYRSQLGRIKIQADLQAQPLDVE